MTDTLKIFGRTFTDVTGIKASTPTGDTLTYTRGGSTPTSDDFVITLSYNSTTEMWEPDCTFAEVQAADTAGKTIGFIAVGYGNIQDVAAYGYYSSGMIGDNLTYLVTYFDQSINRFVCQYYLLDSNGLADDGTYYYDSTLDATVTASDVLSGVVAYGDNGRIVGTYVPPASPTGTVQITTNGTHDVTNYASAEVSVPTPSPSLQSKTVAPTTSQQNVTADSGYDGLSSVTVDAMPSGSASTPATSITANPTITVSSSGLITATASASQSVTPSVTAGYVAIGTAGTITVSGSKTQQLTVQSATTVTPTKSSQTVISAGRYTTGAITVGPIPSQYIIPSGTKTITANGTGIDVTEYASVDVNVPTGGGSTKNVQYHMGYDEVASSSYTATDVSLTVAKTGTYKVSWIGWRSSSSGTSGSQLYIGSTAYGTANTTFTRTYGQSITLTGVSLTQGQTITVRARSRNTSYYMCVGNLIIEEQ